MSPDLPLILKTINYSSSFLKITFSKTFSKFANFLLSISLFSILFFNIKKKKNTNSILCYITKTPKSFYRVPPRGHDPLAKSYMVILITFILQSDFFLFLFVRSFNISVRLGWRNLDLVVHSLARL